jgi:hypothetical protein
MYLRIDGLASHISVYLPDPNGDPGGTLSSLTCTEGPCGAVCVCRSYASHHTRPIANVCRVLTRGPLGPLGFECSQYRQTLRPTVDGARSKALRPSGVQ